LNKFFLCRYIKKVICGGIFENYNYILGVYVSADDMEIIINNGSLRTLQLLSYSVVNIIFRCIENNYTDINLSIILNKNIEYHKSRRVVKQKAINYNYA
jgi:hypothetical protein